MKVAVVVWFPRVDAITIDLPDLDGPGVRGSTTVTVPDFSLIVTFIEALQGKRKGLHLGIGAMVRVGVVVVVIPICVEILILDQVQILESVDVVTVEVVIRVRHAGSAHEVPTDFSEGIRVNVVEARITG